MASLRSPEEVTHGMRRCCCCCLDLAQLRCRVNWTLSIHAHDDENDENDDEAHGHRCDLARGEEYASLAPTRVEDGMHMPRCVCGSFRSYRFPLARESIKKRDQVKRH